MQDRHIIEGGHKKHKKERRVGKLYQGNTKKEGKTKQGSETGDKGLRGTQKQPKKSAAGQSKGKLFYNFPFWLLYKRLFT